MATVVVARFNDRRLLVRLVLGAGVTPDQRMAAYGAIDKLTRESPAKIREKLIKDAAVDGTVADNVLRIFTHQDLAALASAYGSVDGVRDEISRLHEYEAHLGALGFGDFIRFDAAIVRGLAYYTGTVFEIFDRAGELRAVCGGGRYDNLTGSVSGSSMPAVGFGMGDVVLGELLSDKGLLPPTTQSVDYYLISVSEAERPTMLRVAQSLRARGHTVLYSLRQAGVNRQFKDADARGARAIIAIGPDEVKSGQVVVRDKTSGTERSISLQNILNDGL
jgi:histidyl-tRNA synthetase